MARSLKICLALDALSGHIVSYCLSQVVYTIAEHALSLTMSVTKNESLVYQCS